MLKKFNCRILSIEDKETLKAEMLAQVEPTKTGAVKVSNKGTCYNILLRNVKPVVANVIKQEMLSIGADAIVPKGALDLSVQNCNVILTGNMKHFKLLQQKLKSQPFSLKFLGKEILSLIENYNCKNYRLNLKGREFHLKNGKTYIMGILNVTPDSFSDGGKFYSIDSALKQVEKMLEQGADFIDVGGESTRPGAEAVSVDEELKRVIPVIEEVTKRFEDVIISIDTYKAKVAKQAIDAGALIVNDISGLKFDSQMASVVSSCNVPVILMHIKGTPKNMQKNPVYNNLLNEIFDFFQDSLKILENADGDISNVIIDPGIGFGKTFEHNIEILKRLKEFSSLGLPILIGASRKSFLGTILNTQNPEERILGSLSVAAISALRGAKILRVHDVKETYEVLQVADALI
jgi:dihydropteroate synthase